MHVQYCTVLLSFSRCVVLYTIYSYLLMHGDCAVHVLTSRGLSGLGDIVSTHVQCVLQRDRPAFEVLLLSIFPLLLFLIFIKAIN